MLLALYLIGQTKFIREDKPFVLPLCSEEVISSINSVDGKPAASIVERDCGATTDFVRYIVIAGEAKQSATSADDAVAIAEGSGLNNLFWKDRRTLVVRYDPQQTKFFRQEKAWHGFQIVYEAR